MVYFYLVFISKSLLSTLGQSYFPCLAYATFKIYHCIRNKDMLWFVFFRADHHSFKWIHSIWEKLPLF